MVLFKAYLYFYMFIIHIRFPKTKSLHEVICTRYNNDTVKLIRKVEKLDFKRKKSELDLEFLLDCQRRNVVPNYLYFKLANRRLQTSMEYLNCRRILLEAKIEEKRRNTKQIDKELAFKQTILLSKLNWFDLNHGCHIMIVHNGKLIQKQAGIQKKKLINLPSYLPTTYSTTHDPDKVVFNFSSYSLTDADKKLLSKGLNFAIPENAIPYEDYMLPYELFYRGIKKFAKSSEDEMNFHVRLKNVEVSTFSSFKQQSKTLTNLTEEEVESLNLLIKNNNLVIQKADKGNTVVLCESNKKRVKFVFTDKQYSSIAPTGTKPGILYGLPKIHKALVDNLPKFRSIFSMIGTPTYKLSKFLVPLIQPITTNEYTVKDSFQFAQEIVAYDSNLFMSSLDVTSLFTNIRLKETTDIICNELFKNKELINGIDKSVFRELLTLAMTETCFMFDGNLYKQCDGVSMGSPLGPTFANSFMSFHEKNWIDECPDEIKPTKYRRYVDDIFILCRDQEHHRKFMEYMNTRHENIAFTEELADQKAPTKA